MAFLSFGLSLASRDCVWCSPCWADPVAPPGRGQAGPAKPNDTVFPGALRVQVGGSLGPWMGIRVPFSATAVLSCPVRGRRQLLAWEEQVT